MGMTVINVSKDDGKFFFSVRFFEIGAKYGRSCRKPVTAREVKKKERIQNGEET
jgi:hypothetical protein